MHQPGIRVGAIFSATAEEVKLLGYGVYDGDFKPPGNPLGMSDEEYSQFKADYAAGHNCTVEETEKLIDDSPIGKNPRITLDSGDVVWGHQCWWGPEEQIKITIGNRPVVNVRLNHETQAVEAVG